MPEQKKEFNVSELLERKKEIEGRMKEIIVLNPDELVYETQETVDYTAKKEDKKKVFTPRERVDLNSFLAEFNGLVSELAKVKTAIANFNAESVAELLMQREEARQKIAMFQRIKQVFPKKLPTQSREVTREGSEGETLEAKHILKEPMFPLSSVEKQLNEACAQERKLNTEIQKLNLNAKITI
jgi:hypothetical protein